MSDPAVKLARMANQIAGFFKAYPEDEAVAGIRAHIVAFWPPRMRQDLGAALDRSDLQLDPLVVAAIRHETARPATEGARGETSG